MNDPIAMLKQEHREVAAMLRTLSESKKPSARRRQTVEKLVTALSAHLQFEEQRLYPLVEQYVGHEETREASVEHDLARTGIAQLQRMVDQPGFGAVVDMLTAGIRHHVKEEEHEIFPELKRSLDRETLAKLGDEYAAKQPRRRRAA